jgi:hypothetical protein
MSFNHSQQPIEPFKLLGDSLSEVASVYVLLLIIASPGILVNIAPRVLPSEVGSALTIIYGLGVLPILTGISIYFIYRYLKQGTIDLSRAANKAIGQSGQLIIAHILYSLAVILGLICLIVPGIYLFVRWGFVMYAIVSQNCSAIEGFKYSSELIKGRWWAVFGSMLLVIALLLPIFFVTGIIGAIFATQSIVMAIISSIVILLVTPPLAMYYVKLYMRLQEIANLPASI